MKFVGKSKTIEIQNETMVVNELPLSQIRKWEAAKNADPVGASAEIIYNAITKTTGEKYFKSIDEVMELPPSVMEEIADHFASLSDSKKS